MLYRCGGRLDVEICIDSKETRAEGVGTNEFSEAQSTKVLATPQRRESEGHRLAHALEQHREKRASEIEKRLVGLAEKVKFATGADVTVCVGHRPANLQPIASL